MSRRAITSQSDIARAIRAAKAAGAGAVEVRPDGVIKILLNSQELPDPPVEPRREIVL